MHTTVPGFDKMSTLKFLFLYTLWEFLVLGLYWGGTPDQSCSEVGTIIVCGPHCAGD